MQSLLSPLCLLLAIAMAIGGFALWAVEPPEASVELHRARAAGDDDYGDLLEDALAKRQRARSLLLGGLFGGSLVLAAAAFGTMGWRRPLG